jgi:hypothetical protein
MIAMAGLGLLLTVGCPKNGDDGVKTPAPTNEPPTPTPEPEPTDQQPERESLTSAECQAKGGSVVGDIGDGAIHRPDYRCANGQPPIGTIKAAEGEPVAVEGSVCCGA